MSVKEKNEKSIKNDNSVLLLNVRGTMMRVKLAILQLQPDSELAKLVDTYSHFINTPASAFIDRDYKIFAKLIDALGGTAKLTWSRALEAEAEHWLIKLDGLVDMYDQHYLVVKIEKKTGQGTVTDSEGNDISKTLEKVDGLDYTQLLIRYAEAFHYRITNFFPDNMTNQIIVEMTAY
jgi:hypothetical protein